MIDYYEAQASAILKNYATNEKYDHDPDLINKFLSRWEPMAPKQEREVMEKIGVLLYDFCFSSAAMRSAPGLTNWVVRRLAVLLLDGKVSIKLEPLHDRKSFRDYNIAAYIRKEMRDRHVKWDAAVEDAKKRFNVTRSVVKRAWTRHRDKLILIDKMRTELSAEEFNRWFDGQWRRKG
jgi:hypothetical protein